MSIKCYLSPNAIFEIPLPKVSTSTAQTIIIWSLSIDTDGLFMDVNQSKTLLISIFVLGNEKVSKSNTKQLMPITKKNLVKKKKN